MDKFHQFIISFFLLALAADTVTAGPESAAGNNKIIHMALASAPTNLDPRFSTDATSSRINQLLYGSLTDFDDRSQPIPELASWQKISPTTYRFRLLPDRRNFVDGRRLTAADVKATFNSILEPATASPHRGTIKHIRQIREIDADTIEFELERADPLFPGFLNIGILPEHLLKAGHDFNRQPVGNGSFQLLQRPHEKQLLIERRSDGQRIDFLHVPDPTVRVLKLLRGETDLVQNDLPAELISYLEQKQTFRVLRGPGTTFAYIGFNLEDEYVGQQKIRQAIALGIDRAAIMQYLFDYSVAPAESVLPTTHWAGVSDLKPSIYDPESARKLLQSLSYSLQAPLVLTYKTSSDPFRLRLATILQAQLAEIGIQLKISSYDWGTFYGDIKAGNFQMYSLAWVGIQSPDIFRYIFHSSSIPPDGANRGRYRSERVDELLNTVHETSAADLADLYQEVQRQVHLDLVYIPLWYEGNVAIMRDDIKGYRLHTDGNYKGLNQIHRATAHE